MNKYERTPEYILDLHGQTKVETEILIDDILKHKKYTHFRIITGKGTHSETGPVLQSFVKEYLSTRGIHFNPAKIKDGGEGAFEVFTQK